MQDVSGYPADDAARVVDVVVTVNGTVFPVDEVDITAAGGGALPGKASGLSDVFETTATIVFSQDTTAMTGETKIKSPTRPRRGQTVTIDTVENGVTVRQLTGRIKNISAGYGRNLTATVEDLTYRLRNEVTLPPLVKSQPTMDDMPNVTGMNITALFGLDRVLRFCGFTATPPTLGGNAFFSAPMMGSAWPERSRILTANASNQAGYAVFASSEWGLGAESISATYKPTFVSPGSARFNQPMELSMLVSGAASSSGEASFIVVWNDSTWAGVRVTAARKAHAVVCVGGTVTYGSALQLPATECRVGARLHPDGGYYVAYSMDGAEYANVQGDLPSAQQWLDEPPVEVRVSSPSGAPLIGGLMAGYTNVGHWNGWERNAHLTGLSTGNGYYALPAYYGKQALDVVKEAVACDLSAAWIDEHGHFQLRNRDVFSGGPIVKAINAQRQMYDYGWDDGDGTAYTNVLVKYRAPSVSVNTRAVSAVWDGGSSQSLNDGETVTLWAKPADSDVNWLVPDFTLTRIAPANAPDAESGFQNVNPGYGSYYGGTIVDKDGDFDWASDVTLAVSYEAINFETVKITCTARNLAQGQTIDLRTVRNAKSTGLWPARLDKPLPVIRAKGTIHWEDMSSKVGPGDDLGTYIHDAGYWVQDDFHAQRLGNYILNQLTNGVPVLRDLDIAPDTRLQRGDTISITDLDGHGTTTVCTIAGKRISIKPGQLTMTLDVIPQSMTTTWTWGEVDAVRAGRTYDAVKASQSGRTYDNEMIP